MPRGPSGGGRPSRAARSPCIEARSRPARHQPARDDQGILHRVIFFRTTADCWRAARGSKPCGSAHQTLDRLVLRRARFMRWDMQLLADAKAARAGHVHSPQQARTWSCDNASRSGSAYHPSPPCRGDESLPAYAVMRCRHARHHVSRMFVHGRRGRGLGVGGRTRCRGGSRRRQRFRVGVGRRRFRRARRHASAPARCGAGRS